MDSQQTLVLLASDALGESFLTIMPLMAVGTIVLVGLGVLLIQVGRKRGT